MLDKALRLVLVAAPLLFLSGCATQACCGKVTTIGSTTLMEPTVPYACSTADCIQPVQQTTKLVAVGYGSTGAYSRYTQGQRELMAMRAAQVDAYRNLAEQVYGFRVWGNTAVSAFATQNDSVRTYVDAFVRGARVVNLTSIEHGNYEATVEIEISAAFHDCLKRQGRCALPVAAPACISAGCTAPSVHYISQ